MCSVFSRVCRCTIIHTTKEKAVTIGAVILIRFEIHYSAWEMADMHFMCGHTNGNYQESWCLYAEHYPQCRIPSHNYSPNFTGVTSRKALISRNPRYGCVHIEKSGRSWNHRERERVCACMRVCVKNCICWRYRCYFCLENSPWTVTLPLSHPASASSHSSHQLWKGGDLLMASCKMHRKHSL
jgi:hypothetical protein